MVCKNKRKKMNFNHPRLIDLHSPLGSCLIGSTLMFINPPVAFAAWPVGCPTEKRGINCGCSVIGQESALPRVAGWMIELTRDGFGLWKCLCFIRRDQHHHQHRRQDQVKKECAKRVTAKQQCQSQFGDHSKDGLWWWAHLNPRNRLAIVIEELTIIRHLLSGRLLLLWRLLLFPVLHQLIQTLSILYPLSLGHLFCVRGRKYKKKCQLA